MTTDRPVSLAANAAKTAAIHYRPRPTAPVVGGERGPGGVDQRRIRRRTGARPGGTVLRPDQLRRPHLRPVPVPRRPARPRSRPARPRSRRRRPVPRDQHLRRHPRRCADADRRERPHRRRDHHRPAEMMPDRLPDVTWRSSPRSPSTRASRPRGTPPRSVMRVGRGRPPADRTS